MNDWDILSLWSCFTWNPHRTTTFMESMEDLTSWCLLPAAPLPTSILRCAHMLLLFCNSQKIKNCNWEFIIFHLAILGVVEGNIWLGGWSCSVGPPENLARVVFGCLCALWLWSEPHLPSLLEPKRKRICSWRKVSKHIWRQVFLFLFDDGLALTSNQPPN